MFAPLLVGALRRPVQDGLPAARIELKEIDDWNCCGATAAAKTDEFLAVALPARNLGLADATGLGEIMIPCSSCYSRTLVAQKTIAGDPGLKESINAELGHKVKGTIKVSTILEVLLPKVRSGEVAAKIVRKLEGLKPPATTAAS